MSSSRVKGVMDPKRSSVLRRKEGSCSVGMEVTELRNVLNILQSVTVFRIFIGSCDKQMLTQFAD